MTPPIHSRWALILALSVLGAGRVSAQPPGPESALASEVLPEGISAEVWDHALAAHKAATSAGKTTSLKLTIIDYSRPATEKRLWVVDVISRAVLQAEYVAHGEGSGDLLPTRFSNQDGTHQSSLGTFITGTTFTGIRGHSLRLHGLEPGINDNAYARGIVIHGTPGVSAAKARQGKMGRTEGCPAVSSEAAARLIALIAHGTVVFAWYPETSFLQTSAFLDREAAAGRLGSLN
ncbi:MAG TPA: murein L,D-transpeptidase catalytic domain family protein [Gemmatimonadales bacterium]|nr:murein L,D-transpeptidase catalytic domain family protein [Gemmatimonadales bacterium]